MDSNNLQSEDVQLLEDCWFFGNSLHTKSSKSRMLRSYSEPCSSSDFPGNSYEETFESIEKLPLPRLDRTTPATKGSRSNRRAPSRNGGLDRAPSLPTSLESTEEEEIEFSMGKLIRQASLNYSEPRPPRKVTSKSFEASTNLTRQKSRRNAAAAAAAEEQRTNQLKWQKSLKDLEIEELQGFKDLGFDFEEKDLRSKAPSIVPGLQDKKRGEECEERRPYLSEAWVAHSSAPPVPRWGGKRSTEDMKAQIKFWARAVASNVRQEC